MSDDLVLVRLDNVAKRYGRESVLQISELRLWRHQTILLHGSNGSGKSTLLRLIAGISTLGGGNISYHPILKKARLGFLPQTGGLYHDLTVEQNLHLRRRLFGLAYLPAKNLWYLEETGLSALLHKRVVELSGGYQRLTAVAAVLHATPRWLLLDEPFTGIDAETVGVIREGLGRLLPKLDLFVVTAPTVDGGVGVSTQIEIRRGSIV